LCLGAARQNLAHRSLERHDNQFLTVGCCGLNIG
jgi:hypothetical protein